MQDTRHSQLIASDEINKHARLRQSFSHTQRVRFITATSQESDAQVR
jgi:hypothetical protein